MSLPLARAARVLCFQFAAVVIALSVGCSRGISDEQKAVRAELRHALEEHDYVRAVELAARVVGASPQENTGWEQLAEAQLALGDIENAKETLATWRLNVRQPSAKFDEFTGDIAEREQNAPAAFEAWRKALAADAKNVSVLRKLARVQRAQRDSAAENATLTALLQIEERGADRMARALCLRRLHRWTEAFDDSRRAQELAGNDPDVVSGGKLFENLGKFLAEIRELDARLAVTPGDDQLLTDRALLFLRSEDPELALQDSEAAAKLAPWAMRPRLFRAIALIDLGREQECEQLGIDNRLRLAALTPEFLETIARLDSEISAERSTAELYITRGWQLNEIGQPKLALEDANKALEIDANSASACAESAYALAKLGRGEEAFEQIKRATELDANFSTAWFYRGELEMSRGDHTAAIQSFTRGLAIAQTPVALQKREECYRHVGLLAEADEDRRQREALDRGEIR